MGGIGKIEKIGNLDRRITLRTNTYTKGASGEELPGTPTDVVVWAKWEQGSGEETIMGGKDTAESKESFTIRYRTGMTTKWTVIYDSKDYDITFIQELGRKRYLKLMCELRT